MSYEHPPEGNLDAVGNDLQTALNKLPVDLAQDGIRALRSSSELLMSAVGSGGNTSLAEVQARLETALGNLERAKGALQEAKQQIVSYAGSIGMTGLKSDPAGEVLTHLDSPRSPSREDAHNNPSDKRQVKFFKRVGGIEIPDEINPDTEQEIRDHYAQARQQLIELFPSQTKGLNMDRVQAFLDGMGLKRTTTIIVPQSQRNAVLRKLRELVGGNPPPTIGGIYNPGTDLSFIFYDHKAAKANGREFIESTVIHEMAHGSSDRSDICAVLTGPDETGVYIPRTGFIEQPGLDSPLTGVFLEEGFAELMRASYITSCLKRPRGFISHGVDEVMVPAGNSHVPFPAKYLFRGEKGRSISRVESYAGAALDHLIKQDPGLFPALLRARNSAAGIAEVARRINAISPGLYETMRNDFNDTATFGQGYARVLRATGAV